VKLNYGTLVFLAVFVLIFVFIAWKQPWTAPHIAGVAIFIPSFVLFVLARIQLGRAFSIQAKASTLVTTGLYSRIRNPIYVFGSLMIAGIIIWANKPWLLLIFAVIIPMQIYRSRKEAKVLEGEFGAAYLEYKRKTWF
jgi:protein-S-isoprenylcysteine O-methyltransferase Ste14